jgi:hypothetical protein
MFNSRPSNQCYNNPSRSQSGGHNGRSNSPGRRYHARAELREALHLALTSVEHRAAPTTVNLFVIVVVASDMSLFSAKSLHSACVVKLWVISLKPAVISIPSQNIWSEHRGEISHHTVQARNAKFDLQIQKTTTGVPTGPATGGAINSKPVDILIDSGAVCTIIHQSLASPQSIPSTLRLTSPDGSPLQNLAIDQIQLQFQVPMEKENIRAQIDDMLRNGIIEPSNSPWASPVL